MNGGRLYVCTWLWGTKWPQAYIERLAAGLRRNIRQPFQFVAITDREHVSGDIVVQIGESAASLVSVPGCLVRMWMFGREFQDCIRAHLGDRIVNIDVDAVVTRELDPLFDRDDEFTILQHVNQTNPCPFNGSLWMFRAGERYDVWDSFSIHAVRKIRYHSIPDDQGWLHHKFPGAAAWTIRDGVYAFKKVGWPGNVLTGMGEFRHALPENARVVAFPGRAPAQYIWLDWVREHWGEAC